MMAYRMLLADLDGTVIDPGGEVAEDTAAALRRLRAAGHRVILATGRCWRSARPVVRRLGLDEPVICLTGALVKAAGDGRTLDRRVLPAAMVRRTIEAVHGAGHSALVHVDDADHEFDAVLLRGPNTSRETADYVALAGRACQGRHIDEIGDLLGQCLEVSVWGPPAALGACRAAIEVALGDRVHTLIIHAPNVGHWVLEVFGPGVTKWAAARRLAEQAGIAPAEIVAMGDDVNDLEMIRQAGLGVAMSHAVAEVRRAADHVAEAGLLGRPAAMIDRLF